MTVDQAAQILGLDPSTVRHHIAQGKLGAVKYGKAYEISPESLRLFFTSEWAPGASIQAFLQKRLESGDLGGEAQAEAQAILAGLG